MLKKSRKKTAKKIPKAADNSKGQIFYGLHMYPGVAEYRPSRGETFRLLIKEPAIRKMGPTFPGRPIFVHHNEDFSDDLNTLRAEADGWVTDSFYNEYDGKHWAKILLVTDEALDAQANGYTLSNSYEFKRIDESPGVYNGLDYDFEVLDGEYKHMALVPDPRYDSLLLSPEEFKKYNDEQRADLKRVANSNDKKGKTMKKRTTGSKISLSLFKKTSVENSKAKELENLSILLPKSKQEKTIAELVTIADGVLNSKGKARVCNAEDVVLVEGEDGEEEEVTIGEMWEELEDLRARVADIEGDIYETADDEDTVENEDDEDDDEIENADDESDEDDDEVEAPRKKAAAAKKPLKRKSAKNSREDIEEDDEDETPTFKRRASNSTKTQTKQKQKTAKNQRDGDGDRRGARVKADRARNAADRHDREDFASNVLKISTPQSQLARGMEQYGALD